MKKPKPFRESDEAHFRRIVRASIRKGPFTAGQRDITLALFDHWFHHKAKNGGIIHPGRERLAKKSGKTEKTVTRTLAMLRAAGIIFPVECDRGQGRKATRYKVNFIALFTLCGDGWVEFFMKNVPPLYAKMSHQMAGQNVPQIYIPSERPLSNNRKPQGDAS